MRMNFFYLPWDNSCSCFSVLHHQLVSFIEWFFIKENKQRGPAAAAAPEALDSQQIYTSRRLSVLSGRAAASLPFRIVGLTAIKYELKTTQASLPSKMSLHIFMAADCWISSLQGSPGGKAGDGSGVEWSEVKWMEGVRGGRKKQGWSDECWSGEIAGWDRG